MATVSTVITTYKRPISVVARAIQSVLKQTYRDFELIVVDDSPADYGERQKIKEYIDSLQDERVILIQHTQNLGACAARNTGIRNATGAYLAFLDDDDEWLSTKLEKQMQKMMSANYGLVYCRQNIVNEVKGCVSSPERKYYEGAVFDQLILTNFIGSTSFVLIKKECFYRVGMFDKFMPASQDLEMWLRISQEYMVGFVDEALVNYYIHAGESITGNYQKKLMAIKRLLEIYHEYFQQHPYQRSVRYLKAAPYFGINHEYGNMIKYYCCGVAASPFAIKRNIEYLARTLRAVVLRKV